jgi:glutathione synthase/RimK-type ligase-like ATP-grasp enzyme
MTRAAFLDTLRSVATKHGLEFQSMSHDWIIQISDPKTGRICTIFGYTFDTNPAAAAEVCREKAATSLVLARHEISNIDHTVFLNPACEYTENFVAKTGNWAKIHALVEKLGFPMVLKPLKGTGGMGVFKAYNWREVEAAVQRLFEKEYGLAISPYKKIVDEYRCIMVGQSCKMTYRKVRSHIVGDGSSSVHQLVQAQLNSISDHQELLKAMAAMSEMRPEELAVIPKIGEQVPLQWKHNLGQGATVDLNIDPGMKARLHEMAVKAVTALGMRFCSVDIVVVDESGSKSMMVMEVNCGVMMDSFIDLLGKDGQQFAYDIYEQAVLVGLGLIP